ncbi:hypothetical protein [Streptomyces sp. NPDC048357]|uniref:hypothetical protein n=1 Tax=Streptomyces sp. NPDC048357 TaxID=3154719 RepID=UPI00341F5D68
MFPQDGPDSSSDVKQVLEDTLHVMHGGPPATAHGRALADIWQAMAWRMHARQRHRLAEATRDFAQQVADMLTVLRRSRLGADRTVAAHLHNLEYVISGNLEQARFAPRSHGTAELIHRPIDRGTVTLHAGHTDHRQPPAR